MILVAATLALLILAGLFSGYETGLYVCDPFKAQGRKRGRSFGARPLVALLDERPKAVVALLIMTNICLFFASTCFTRLLVLAGLSDSVQTALLSSALFSPIVVVFAEMLPKDLFRMRSDPLLYRFAHLIWALYWVMRVVLWAPFHLFSRRRLRSSFLTRDEMEFHLMRHLRRGSIIAHMAANILRIGQRRLKDVMIPRRDCVTVFPQTEIADVVRTARRHRFSRLPVVDPQNPAKVLGVVNIFDMFYRNADKVADVMRPPLRLGLNMALDDALLVMRVRRHPLAVVTNNRGAFSGVVTIKDIVEEITGEIRSW